MIEIDTKEIKKFVKNLKSTSKDAYPKAVRSTLDNLAFNTQKKYKVNVKNALTIRGGSGNIVMKSIHYQKCRSGLDVSKMESRVGQLSQVYGKETVQLRKQEFGENITAKRKHLLKPTKFARGGSYRKLVKKGNLVAKLDTKRIEDIAANPVKGDIKKQFRQGIAIAHRQHKTINFVPDAPTTGKKWGVFQFWDSGTVIKKGKPHAKGKAAKLLYPFKEKTQHLQKRPMLKPATDENAKKGGEIFVNEANRRIAKEMAKGLKT